MTNNFGTWSVFDRVNGKLLFRQTYDGEHTQDVFFVNAGRESSYDELAAHASEVAITDETVRMVRPDDWWASRSENIWVVD